MDGRTANKVLPEQLCSEFAKLSETVLISRHLEPLIIYVCPCLSVANQHVIYSLKYNSCRDRPQKQY